MASSWPEVSGGGLEFVEVGPGLEEMDPDESVACSGRETC